MQDLIAFLITPIVEDPEDFEVDVEEADASVLIELRATEEELDRIRGKDNVTIDAIRQVLSASGGKRKPVLELIAYTDDDYTDDDGEEEDEGTDDGEADDDEESDDES